MMPEKSKNEFERLSITYLPIDDLAAHPGNSRTHNHDQIHQIAASMKEFGFSNPVLIDHKNVIIAGHGRVAAAKLLGMKSVPTIRLKDLSEDQVRAYLIADNRLAEKAGWDKSTLAIELQHLLSIDCNFDVTITGFEVPEIDPILQEAARQQEDDDIFKVDEKNRTVTRPGDLWQLGRHCILCGDALEEGCYSALMQGRLAAAVFTDPPFNDPIDGYVAGFGRTHHREFTMASGEMTGTEYTDFLFKAFKNLERNCEDGSLNFVCLDWRHLPEILTASRRVYTEFKNLCVWVKENGGQGSLYRSRHELVFVFKSGKGKHRNNIQVGKHGRYRTNIWEYPRVKSSAANGGEQLSGLHPTIKPVVMVADAILDCTARNDVVLDPFLGSGTTVIAAERTGRICYGMDLDPGYIDTALRRWQRVTNLAAVLAATGQTFAQRETEALNARQ
jgi:DNA modification methylase